MYIRIHEHFRCSNKLKRLRVHRRPLQKGERNPVLFEQHPVFGADFRCLIGTVAVCGYRV
jgi:hypothetical protein